MTASQKAAGLPAYPEWFRAYLTRRRPGRCFLVRFLAEAPAFLAAVWWDSGPSLLPLDRDRHHVDPEPLWAAIEKSGVVFHLSDGQISLLPGRASWCGTASELSRLLKSDVSQLAAGEKAAILGAGWVGYRLRAASQLWGQDVCREARTGHARRWLLYPRPVSQSRNSARPAS